jgi:hypothetical protein
MKAVLLCVMLAASAGHAVEGVRIAWPASLNVAGDVAVSNLPMDPATNATMTTSVAISTVPVQVVKANPSRRGLFLYNPSTTSLYIAYDSTATYATHFSFAIPTASAWIMPQPIYQGIITAVRAATGDGKILITEMQ